MRFWITLTTPIEAEHISAARKKGEDICMKLEPVSYVTKIET